MVYNSGRVIEPSVAFAGAVGDEERGIALCRAGDWDRGLSLLGRRVAEQGRLTSQGYSFLGYGLASRRKQLREGLQLCEHAVKLEFYQPENLLNLAKTRLLTGDRRGAMGAVRRGLAIDAEHSELVALAEQLGERRPPIVAFLSRGHFVNVILGRLRHVIKS